MGTPILMGRPTLALLLLAALPLWAWGGETALRPAETARVVFQGNATFSEGELLAAGGLPAPGRRRLFSPKPRIPESGVDMAVTEILLFYRRQGFFEAKVRRSAFGPQEAVLEVEEGPRVVTASVSVRLEEGGGEVALLLAPLLGRLPIEEGGPFTADAYESTAALLQRSLAEGGYPFAEVTPEAVVDLATHTASAFFRVDPGRRGVFGEVFFQGLVHGEEGQLRKVLTFRQGDLFRLSELERSQEALYRTGLFESVVLRPRRKGPEGEIPIVIQVKEGRHRRFKAGVGYGSEEKARWQAAWETVRVRDRMVNAGLSIRNSSLERQAVFTVRRPYWPGRDTALAGEAGWAWLRLPAFEYRTFFARGGVEHAFSTRWSLSLFAASERVFYFVPESDFVLGRREQGRSGGTLLSLPGKATLNHADDPYDPHRGFLLAFTAEPTYGLGTSFVKTTAEGRLYLPAGDDRVLAARLRVGGILGGGSIGHIFPTRRFFAGGQNSLRAFRFGVLGPLAEEGKIRGGKGLLEVSTELRFPLCPALTGVLFADAGNATENPFAAGGLTLFSDAGGGIRFKTPVGPVGLDLAFKLKRTPVDRSAYQLAFYVGYAF